MEDTISSQGEGSVEGKGARVKGTVRIVTLYCTIIRGDVVAVNYALDQYHECKFLMCLAVLLTREMLREFTSCLKEYDSTIKADEWRTPVLLKMKEALKAKELDSKGYYVLWILFVITLVQKLKFLKLFSHILSVDHKHEVARAYDIAVDYYKMTKNMKEAISCQEKATHLFLDIERLNTTRGLYQKTTDLFQSMDLTSSANQCNQKIAEYSAKVGKYQRSITMFEEIATYSIRNNLLKYGLRGHLLNACICQLCRGDVVAINHDLERYQVEYIFLS
ncbi:hypothetical protein H5410_027484 [Solanum commersonii]|uniref:Uncharacterized protein n=1 Tax=Solanum commersonii TaxID=4109 RepID=A0A9J5Z1Z0_SOLCO|nr:hypothetical protein H5410_027484 [Solanum commersonii]